MSFGKMMCVSTALVLSLAPAAAAQCRADIDGSGVLDFFDFLGFQDLFVAGDLRADFTGDGVLDFFDFLAFQDEYAAGCPVAAQLAGVPLDQYPRFNFVRAFNMGADVTLAIDPTRYAVAGASGEIYIVAAKTAAQWAMDPSLEDVRGAPQPATFTGSAIQDNIIALAGSSSLSADAGLGISVGYDLVIDLNRNGVLDGGDLIDGLSDEAGFYVVTDLTAPGPLTPVMLDASLSAGPVRLYYPQEIATLGPRPVITVVHGGGHDYRWYDYLQEHLSSWGYISISVRNDFSATGGPPILHTDALLAQQATFAGGVLNGLIDDSRIIWIGHSLGGREVVVGVEALATGAIPARFGVEDLALVSAIAANSSHRSTLADPRDVNFHMIWGSADGDIIGRPQPIVGDQLIPFRHYDRAAGFKHSTYIHGADHNDFNCCGANNFQGPAPTEIGRDEAQRIAKAMWLALVKRYAEGDVPALDYLTRPWESFKPLGVSPDTTLVHMYRVREASDALLAIDDYQTNPSLELSSSGAPVSFTVDNLFEGRLQDMDSIFTWMPTDPMNGMTYAGDGDATRGAVFEWPSGSPRHIEFTVPAAGRDATQWDMLSLRACQQTRHPLTIAELGDITFTVTLADGAGRSSSINIGAYGGGIEEPYQREGAGSGVGWQNEFETIRIRLTDFATNGSGVDLADIRAVRLDFGGSFGSAQGRLGLDEVEFVLER